MILRDELKKIIQEEGDYKEFEYKGLHCIIRRVRPMCHLCGYVEIPKTLLEKPDDWYEDRINVHGGVTYVGDLPVEEKKKIRVIGFDCAHIYDLVPQLYIQLNMNPLDGDSYRDMDFCQKECEHMADQLLEYDEVFRS